MNIAFICVHNSCRSQIAEAFAKALASDSFHAYSGGSEVKTKINQDAVRLMKELHHIDMEASQRPKTVDLLPKMDVVITMGCQVTCPALGAFHREDWGLDDPTGKGDLAFKETIETIRRKVLDLKARVQSGAFDRSE